ncbi:MAG: hemolysin family protein [Chloroflexi bacterium]|nr:hemolysin family protein [Chloroflexota bacterium]
MDEVSGLLIILFVICLILASFFSSAETAFMGTQKLRLQHLVETHPKGKIIARIIESPEKFLAMVLLGINFFETAMATIGTIIAVSLWGQNLGAAIATIFLTLVTLIFAEFVPKSLAANHGEKLALFYARPIDLTMKIFYPLIYILNHIGFRFLKLFGGIKPRLTISEEEFHTLISVSNKEGTVEPEQAEMLHNIFSFGDRPVREVMVPRPDVIFIEKGTILVDFLNIYKEHPQSRFPSFEGNRDKVVGILSIKDILMAQANGTINMESTIDELVRPPCFAPETKPIGDLLIEMRDKNYHLCIVVDEYGGTAGVVTMNQLIEEIIGPVGEELTGIDKEYEILDEYTFQIDGGMHIDEVNEKMELGIPEGDYETIAGFILHLIGRIPRQGEQLKYKDLKIVITKVVGVKIEDILVTKEKRKEDDVLSDVKK